MAGIIMVSHCLLNPMAKVKSSRVYDNVRRGTIVPLIEKGFAIIQLPCPELTCGGLKRWGQTRSQYDNVFFKAHCSSLTEGIADQLEEYRRNNFRVGPVLGINGSPSCGVDTSCDGPWGGEFEEEGAVIKKIKDILFVQRPGVFMEVLEAKLNARGIRLNYIGIDEDNPEASLGRVLKVLENSI